MDPSSRLFQLFLVFCLLVLCHAESSTARPIHSLAEAVNGSPSSSPVWTDRILQTSIQSLVFRRGALTTGKRLAAVQQLECAAHCANPLDTVMCRNMGLGDGVGINWQCESDDMPDGYRFGQMKVSCEGYSNSADPYVLAGSCQLSYSLLRDSKDAVGVTGNAGDTLILVLLILVGLVIVGAMIAVMAGECSPRRPAPVAAPYAVPGYAYSAPVYQSSYWGWGGPPSAPLLGGGRSSSGSHSHGHHHATGYASTSNR